MTDTASNVTAQNDTVAEQTSGDTSTDQSVESSQTAADKLYGEKTDDGSANANPDESQTAEDQDKTGDEQDDDQKEGEQGDPQTEIQDFTMPEGMELDTELAGELKAFIQEKNLSQEDGQMIADLGVKMLQKQQSAFESLREQWAQDAKTDKEIGGEQFEANVGAANKALGTFGSPELVNYLQETGLGNHPEMIRAWYKVSQAVSEDKIVTGGNAAGRGDLTHEQRMFPDMK